MQTAEHSEQQHSMSIETDNLIRGLNLLPIHLLRPRGRLPLFRILPDPRIYCVLSSTDVQDL